MKMKNSMTNTNIFSTDSFQLASYLLSESVHLIETNKSNPKRVLFIFEESDLRKKLTDEFLAYKAKIEPHRFASAQKDLKQIIYS
ncbi:MAG: hypothetical protein ACD_51C00361G0003 [uncultured bacterium]|nr:MAG: hypothetical protein ACD_51C00361G0003 [uncultured bacterium]